MGMGYEFRMTPRDVIIALQPPVRAGRPDRQRALAEQPEGEATLLFTAKVDATVTSLGGLGLKFRWEEEESDPDKTEVERQVRTKRIFNPEDSEQYVDVEVIDSIVFTDTLNKSSRFTLDND